MPNLPPSTDFTNSSVTEGGFKTAITFMREYLADLLGADGINATALATLGAVFGSLSAKSANYTVITSDRGKIIQCTGTIELALTAASTLGSSFSFVIHNAGSGIVTINPNGTELIDGSANKIISEGQSVVIFCDGINFYTIGGSAGGINSQVFTTSGNFTVPAGISKLKVTVIGGGGNGGSGSAQAGGGGGGSGGVASGYVVDLVAGQIITVTVGSAGSTSSFGTYLTATGGSNGSNGSSTVGGAGGNGGVGGGNFGFNGSKGGNGGFASGDSGNGGVGAGLFINAPNAPDGPAFAQPSISGLFNSFGGGTTGRTSGVAGSAGTKGGGGGGGHGNNNGGSNAGGAGGAGIVIIEY